MMCGKIELVAATVSSHNIDDFIMQAKRHTVFAEGDLQIKLETLLVRHDDIFGGKWERGWFN